MSEEATRIHLPGTFVPAGTRLSGIYEIDTPLAVFSAVRAGSFAVLQHLTEGDLVRHAEHSERGRYTLDEWLRDYTRHPLEHGEQFVKALPGEC